MSSTELLAELVGVYASTHPRDTGRLLLSLPSEQVTAFLADAAPATAAVVLQGMPIMAAGHYISLLEVSIAAGILRALPADLVAHLLRDEEQSRRDSVLETLPAEFSRQVRHHLDQTPGTVGSIMMRRPACVMQDATVAEAREQLASQTIGAVPYVYLVDGHAVITGVVNLEDLLKSEPSAPVASFAHGVDTKLPATASVVAAENHPGWQQHNVLPVVDGAGVMIGCLDHRSLLRDLNVVEPDQPASVAAALGELYKIGLEGFLQAAGGPAGQPTGRNTR